MPEASMQSRSLVISHVALRRVIGWLGISLPFILLAGNWISARTPQPGSISGYYYTDMRNFFVGGLCALGICLLAYRGHDRADGLVADVAGVNVILVALFPTKPLIGKHYHLTFQQNLVGDLHVLFAAVTLLALGVMALRFARLRRLPEAVVYRTCAVTIFACVVLAIAPKLLLVPMSAGSRPLFILEVLAMLASGVSWLVPIRTEPNLSLSTAETAAASIPVLIDASPFH